MSSLLCARLELRELTVSLPVVTHCNRSVLSATLCRLCNFQRSAINKVIMLDAVK